MSDIFNVDRISTYVIKASQNKIKVMTILTDIQD